MLRLTLLIALIALALAAAARAQTGGAAAPEPGPISLAPADATVGAVTVLRGTAPAGRAVSVERFDTRTQAWTPAARATAAPDGTFAAGWRPPAAGRTRLRAVAAQGASAAALSAEIAVTVYRSALATYYGPGFYGRRTACGFRMSRKLLGVAHKTLPCGTQVAVRYGSAALVVPVVDRGPFRRGTSYDLTSATATALGFPGLARIGAVALRELPRVAPPPAPAAARQPSR